MDNSQLHAEINALSAPEAKEVLNTVVGEFVDRQETDAIVDEMELRRVLTEMATISGFTMPHSEGLSKEEEDRAIKTILLALADAPSMKPALRGALEKGGTSRSLTAALVLAGITLVLTTKFDYEIEKKDRQKPTWKFKMSRTTTTETFLKKFIPFLK